MKMTMAMIITSVLSTSITYFININLKKGPVLASALVTLFAGVFFPYFFSQGGTLAAMATSASYAAMVSQKKFPKISDMIFVGIICGLIFSTVQDAYVGVGGKLGTIAAISGFTWLGIKKVGRIVNKPIE